MKVAFGSCYGKPGVKSDIFETIASDSPDVFVWLGDASYMSSRDPEYHSDPDAYYKRRLQETWEAKGY